MFPSDNDGWKIAPCLPWLARYPGCLAVWAAQIHRMAAGRNLSDVKIKLWSHQGWVKRNLYSVKINFSRATGPTSTD